MKQGEALIQISLAIEYPDEYRNQRNWFTHTVSLNIKEKLTVGIPEFINSAEK
jgi:hypothetical protein